MSSGGPESPRSRHAGLVAARRRNRPGGVAARPARYSARTRGSARGGLIVGGQQQITRGDIPPELRQMLTAPAYALQEIRLVVVSTTPKGIVLIDANTWQRRLLV